MLPFVGRQINIVPQLKYNEQNWMRMTGHLLYTILLNQTIFSVHFNLCAEEKENIVSAVFAACFHFRKCCYLIQKKKTSWEICHFNKCTKCKFCLCFIHFSSIKLCWSTFGRVINSNKWYFWIIQTRIVLVALQSTYSGKVVEISGCTKPSPSPLPPTMDHFR